MYAYSTAFWGKGSFAQGENLLIFKRVEYLH